MQTQWEHRYAVRTQGMKSSAIRELLKYTSLPGIISFGGGFPAPEVFPIKQFRDACDTVLTEMGEQALQYGQTEGYYPLRELIAKNAAKYGIVVSPQNVLITSGSQQALDLFGKVFINRGDRILVESPTYLGALQAWNAYGAQYVTIPSDEEGMQTQHLEELIKTNLKFIYVLPNFQNPTGVTLSLERRKQLIEIANLNGIPIIEDDPYGQLRYEGEHLPPVVVLDDEIRSKETPIYSGNVIYTSTFSKILAPGLRLAWVVAPEDVIKKLTQAKQGTDLHTSTLNQFVAYHVANSPFMKEHIQNIRVVYRERRDTMLKALADNMPEGTSWTSPKGGLFLWVMLPEGYDTSTIFPKAIEEKVAYVPGEAFHPNGGGKNTMRLNFSACKPDVIIEGIKRLSRVLKESLAH